MATAKKAASKAAPAKKATPAPAPAPKAASKPAATTTKAAAAPAKKSAGAAAPATPAAKKRTPNSAFMKPQMPDAALAAIVGSKPLPRTEIVKQLWAYIKKHNLQDAANKRNINADAKLKAVFGKDQVNMFELAGLIGKHIKS